MALIQSIKKWFAEDQSGKTNMVINLAILFLLFTVAAGIRDLKQTVSRVEQQTTGTLQPVMEMKTPTDEEIRRLVLNVLITKLQEAQDDLNKDKK